MPPRGSGKSSYNVAALEWYLLKVTKIICTSSHTKCDAVHSGVQIKDHFIYS